MVLAAPYAYQGSIAAKLGVIVVLVLLVHTVLRMLLLAPTARRELSYHRRVLPNAPSALLAPLAFQELPPVQVVQLVATSMRYLALLVAHLVLQERIVPLQVQLVSAHVLAVARACTWIKPSVRQHAVCVLQVCLVLWLVP